MTRPRGRPSSGQGVTQEAILAAALALLEEGAGQALTLRALATRLGVTPMSLYHHVGDYAGLLRAVSDRVYAEALAGVSKSEDPTSEIRDLLSRYYGVVGRHPQLTLALFATPEALTGTTRRITNRLTSLLTAVTPDPVMWRDILIDHAHGSGLALCSARGELTHTEALQDRYHLALDCLLRQLPARSR